MKLLIYGGSFNPPHLAHLRLAKLSYENVNPDMAMIVPASSPPHKELSSDSPDAEVRMRLCKLAFKELSGFEVSDIELKRQDKSYTWKTVEELKKLYGNPEIYLAIGSDMFLGFEKIWNHSDYILRNVSLVALARENDEAEAMSEYKQELSQKYSCNVEIIASSVMPMSSTEIRGELKQRKGRDKLPEEVYREIIRLRLYDAKPELSWLMDDSLKYIKDSERKAHVRGCAKSARELALRWDFDADTAEEAAILHDLTKNMETEFHLMINKKYGSFFTDAELENGKLMHAKTSAYFARELYGISEEVFSAIYWHTTGKPNMTKLEKLVYLADLIEENRRFKDVAQIRKLAFEDLDMAMRYALTVGIEKLKHSGIQPCEDSVHALSFYGGKK